MFLMPNACFKEYALRRVPCNKSGDALQNRKESRVVLSSHGYKIKQPPSPASTSSPSSFSISFRSVWKTSGTCSPVLLEHSTYGIPQESASRCASYGMLRW
jgi:hypothetical protein